MGVPGWSPWVGAMRGGHSPTCSWAAHHSLVERLVLYPALPEVFAGFWCWGEIRKDNFLFLKEKDKELGGKG